MKHIIITLAFLFVSTIGFAAIPFNKRVASNGSLVLDNASSISKSEVRLLFFGQKRIYLGRKVRIYFQPWTSSITRRFSKNVLGLEVEQLKDKIESLYITGQSSKPAVLRSEKSMFKKLSSKTNSVGYISDKWLIKIDEEGRIKFIYIEE